MKRRTRKISVVFSSLVLLAQALASAPSAVAGTGCSLNTLAPRLHATTASQGLPYSTLVRGKKTVVRFYLTLPECASATQWIKLTGASLAVGRDGSNESLGAVPNKNSLSTPPLISPYNAPAKDSTGDPFFAVPASALAPSSTTAAFGAKFTAKLSYVSSLNTKAVETQFSFVAPVAAKTNNLRILGIPMGDPSRTMNDSEVQFSSGFEGSAADHAIKGFGTLARIFPVQQGTGSLAENSGGGIRYTLNLAGLVDVSDYMTEGTAPDAKFCGDSRSASAIQGQLSDFLTQYNTANPLEKMADRALGLIDGAISVACFQGYAGIAAREAWSRVVPGSNQTGSIIAMEEAHNSGATSPIRASQTDPYHSLLTYADGSSPDRGYNVNAETFLADDRTVMKYAGQPAGWGDDRTIFEKGDWEQAFCRLGGPVTADCHVSVPEGVAGAGAGSPQFNVVGLTDGTPAGTQILDSFRAEGPSTSPGGSEYVFVQRKGSQILDTDPVLVAETHSGHDDITPDVHEHAEADFFSFSYQAASGADRWELWRGQADAAGSVLLAGRSKAASSPTAGSVTLEEIIEEPRSVTFDDATPLDQPNERYANRGVLIGPEESDGSVPAFFADVTASSRPMTLVNDRAVVGDESVPPIGGPQPMTIRFVSPADSVTMNLGNGLLGTKATLTAYGLDGEILGQSQVIGFGKAVSTPIEINVEGITRVELLYTDADGTASAQSEQIDDLRFTPGFAGTYRATSSATGDDPASLRGAFFSKCPSQNLPLAVALPPSRVEGNTAFFEYAFSAGLACADGDQAGLMFRANDGFETSAFSSPAYAERPNRPPLPAIDSPTINASVVQHRSIALSGQAYDISRGALPGSQLEWFLEGPGFGKRSVGTGTDLSVPAPAANGGRWEPGTYEVTLRATNFSGLVSEAHAQVEVKKDADNDGIPEDVEVCLPSTTNKPPDEDPFNAFPDFDGDGYRNLDDVDPCVHDSSFILSANFDPDSANIPSNGNDYTYYLTGNSNLSKVVGSSVRISKIDGEPLEANPFFSGKPLSWEVRPDGVAVAKFDRQAVESYLIDRGLHGRFINFTIVGQGVTGAKEWTFEGNDAALIRLGR